MTTISLNTEATEIENKVPDNANLATKATLNAKSQKLKVKYLVLQIKLPRLF